MNKENGKVEIGVRKGSKEGWGWAERKRMHEG